MPEVAGVATAPRLVVMGVCGSGKSTVGRRLATSLGTRFLEADELHSPQNVAQMASGVPLSDADRQSWLLALAENLRRSQRQGGGLVIACSALKRSYRDQLREACEGLQFVHLQGSPELFAQRLSQRQHHYMPASLLQSQFEILEPPAVDEGAMELDAALDPDMLVRQVLESGFIRSVAMP